MRRRLACAILTGLTLATTAASATERVAWSYSGHLGPQSWGLLSPEFSACRTGQQQSPIDLTDPIETQLPQFELYWKRADWKVHNTGQAIELRADDMGFALLQGERWELTTIRFHAPSEHRVRGIRFPVEIQFIHENEAGAHSVLSVLGRGSGRNDTFEAIIADAPLSPIDEPGRLGRMSLAGLVTDLGDLMRYRGSLTAPPCTQNVTWSVLTDPLYVSDAAILALTSIYDNNARPLQDRNRRYILTD